MNLFKNNFIVLLLWIALQLFCGILAHVTEDFYEILGVQMDATQSQIKKAHRKLSLKYHPDKTKGDKDAEETFLKITRAYQVLSDEEKRQIYDLEGLEALEEFEKSEGRPKSGFEAFFGGGGKPKGPDASLRVDVTLEELYSGAVKNIRFNRNVICRKCRGTGAKDGKTTPCKKCSGRGVVNVIANMGGFQVQMQQPCPKCGGKGKHFTHKCPHCNGEKIVPEVKSLEVDIEKGMPSDHRIVFEKQSEQRPGMIPGDVLFLLHQKPHQHFRRNGNDLHYGMQITLKEALLGFDKKIQHLDNRMVPVMSDGIIKPHEVHLIPEEGMPVHHVPSKRGDLHVEYEIKFPETLNQEQKNIVMKLFPY